MMKNSCSIESFQIIKFNCDVNVEENVKTELITNAKISYRVPKDESIKKLMLQTEFAINSKTPDVVSVLLVSQTVFNTEDVDGNLHEYIQNVCFPEIKNRMSIALKKITTEMGITPIEIN